MALELLEERCFVQHIFGVGFVQSTLGLEFANVLFARARILKQPNLLVGCFLDQMLFFKSTEN